MDKMLSTSVFFGVFVSIAGYEIGLLLKRKFNLALFNPLLIAIVVVMVILAGTGVDYESYNEGAKYLSYLLTPATVCLAVPLYQQLSMLKSNYKAICGGIVAGVLTSILSVLGLCVICVFDHQMYVTLLPKSITTAIGMGVSEELGGLVTVTVAVIIIPVYLEISSERQCLRFSISRKRLQRVWHSELRRMRSEPPGRWNLEK